MGYDLFEMLDRMRWDWQFRKDEKAAQRAQLRQHYSQTPTSKNTIVPLVQLKVAFKPRRGGSR